MKIVKLSPIPFFRQNLIFNTHVMWDVLPPPPSPKIQTHHVRYRRLLSSWTWFSIEKSKVPIVLSLFTSMTTKGQCPCVIVELPVWPYMCYTHYPTIIKFKTSFYGIKKFHTWLNFFKSFEKQLFCYVNTFHLDQIEMFSTYRVYRCQKCVHRFDDDRNDVQLFNWMDGRITQKY